jgi:PTH1 family peptidyl-tRNA hydrolase
LIVGLGNPGIRYAFNRHNIGFIVLDRLAESLGTQFTRRRFDALLAETNVESERVMLAKPQAFMNLSGRPVAKLVAFHHISARDIIVVYDDLDLPYGRIRLRPKGSAGGHHGMESIIASLGHSDLARLRVGIGRPDTREDIGHVLGNFSDEEQKTLDDVLTRAVDALQMWVRDGIERAMNEFNSL